MKDKSKKREEKKNVESEKNSLYRSNLLSVISHEINTPLSLILNSLSMLEEKYPQDNEYLPMFRRNAERLKHTVQNIMQLAEADAGALRVRLSEMDFRNFLLLRREWLKKSVEKEGFFFAVDFEENLPNVCADARRLARAFDTLVMNAIKFSSAASAEQEKKIRVKLHMGNVDEIPVQLRRPELETQTGLCLVVSVSSSLPALGTVPENFEQLFEPFSPWRDVNSREKDGLGVELALSREILMAHHGYIWAGAPEIPGEGWVFRFALPILSRIDELGLVINNRLFGELSSLSKISLLVIHPEPGSLETGKEQAELGRTIEKILFRSSDSIFWVPETGELTILMDDCDTEGAKKVAKRIIQLLRAEKPKMGFVWASVTAPDDGSNAQELLHKARSSWVPGS